MSNTTPTPTEILSRRVHCYTDAAGREYQTLTLPADGWALLEKMLMRDQVREAALAEIACVESGAYDGYDTWFASGSIKDLCRRLGVEL